jgi:threonine synthase
VSITLGEGNTPLIRSRAIGPAAGLRNLFFKLESVNPTGSYKDRFAVAAVSHMIARGQKNCIATSSGNTGAALAAYCAAAQIRCRIAIVETAPTAKLQQMMAYGAEIFRVQGFGTDAAITTQAITALEALGKQPGHALQISAYKYSPHGMKGVETIAQELAEQSEGEIGHVFCPAGGGGLTLSVGRGFAKTKRSPAVHCVQPEGNDTIAGALRDGSDAGRDVVCTTTISGLQVASVIDGHEVIRECRPTGGMGHLVTDEETWAAQRRLAREEGVFSEPAGAVAVAGALNAAANNEIDSDSKIICLVTGSGFKDAASVDKMNADADCPLIGVDEIA